MRKQDYIILVDMDDVLENLLPTWITYLNQRYNLNVDVSKITSWDISGYFPTLTPEQLYSPLVEDDFWLLIKPLPGAVEYMRKFVDEGFTVRVCTASSPTSYALKMKYFIKEYIPFLDTRLHCLCVHDKQLVRGDVLLDDNYRNLIGGSYQGVLFNRSHNATYNNPQDLPRVSSWEEFYSWVQFDFKRKQRNSKQV